MYLGRGYFDTCRRLWDNRANIRGVSFSVVGVVVYVTLWREEVRERGVFICGGLEGLVCCVNSLYFSLKFLVIIEGLK